MKNIKKHIASALLLSLTVGLLPTATIEAYAAETYTLENKSEKKSLGIESKSNNLEESEFNLHTRNLLDVSKFKRVSDGQTIGTITDSQYASQKVNFTSISSYSTSNFSLKLEINASSPYLKDDFYKVNFYTKSGNNLSFIGGSSFTSIGYNKISLNSIVPKNLFENQPYIYAIIGIFKEPTESTSNLLQFKVKNPFYKYTSSLKSFNTSSTSGQPVNTKIKLKAAANYSDTLYQFYVKDPSGKWTKLKGMGPRNYTYWTPTKAGTYKLRVRAKHKKSSKKYDSYKDLTFKIYEPSKVSALTTNKPSGTKKGTKITVSSKTNSTSNNYCEFYVKNSYGKWTKLKGMGPKHYAYWRPTKAGKYTIRVRSKHKNSRKKYDSYKDISFTVK